MSARTSSCHASEETALQYAKLGGSYSVQTPRDFAMVRSWRKCPFKRLHAEGDIVGHRRSSDCLLEPQAGSMGDKSRKSKERQKKQDTAQKSRKKADALAKANPSPTTPLKRGK